MDIPQKVYHHLPVTASYLMEKLGEHTSGLSACGREKSMIYYRKKDITEKSVWNDRKP